MGWVEAFRERVRAVLSRTRMDDDLDEEIRFHLEMEVEKNLRAGVPAAEARRRALVAFGGVDRFKEQAREERGVTALEEIHRDLRFSLRSLRRAPGLVVVTVLSLGLGIGASATVFSLAKGMLLGDVGPLGSPERIVAVYPSEDGGGLYGETSFPDYADLASSAGTMEALAAHRLGVLTVGDAESGDRAVVELVTGEYFDVLGVTPALGRTFLPEESVPGRSERVMVLSHRAWQQRFGADPGVLGETLKLDGETFTVVGVAPKGLAARYMRLDIDGWVLLGVPGGIYRVSPRKLQDRRSRQFFMLGRLAPGRSIQEAQAEMSVLADRLRGEHPSEWSDSRGSALGITVVSEADSRVPPDARTPLLGAAGLVLAGALFILLLACANVASLLLARTHGRGQEMAVRASLGAGKGRLFRMLLTESVVLSLLGGVLALLLADRATAYFRAIPFPMNVPLRIDASLDASAVVFALTLALGSSLVAGLGPSLRGARSGLSPALKRDGEAGFGKTKRVTVRSILVVAQVSAATFFVIGAGLALRSLQASAAYDVGLNPEDVAIFWQEPPDEELAPADLRARFLELAARIEAHPEVESIALARVAEAHVLMEEFATAAVERADGDPLRASFNAVTPGYFEMLEIPLARGRTIDSGDVDGAQRVAMVNEAFLERFLPGSTGVGERFRVVQWSDVDRVQEQEPVTLEIVGVVASPKRPGSGRDRPFFWVSYLQDDPVRAIVLAKGRGGVEAILPVLGQEAPRETRGFTPLEPGSYADYVAYRFMGHKIISSILSFSAFFALILAFIGVFGIVSFAVSRRFREMAIRQAMGARREEVVADVLRRSLRGTGVGILLGLGLALPLAFAARTAMLGVAPLDPVAVGGGILLLVGAALIAGAVPARRLLRAEPMDILREE